MDGVIQIEKSKIFGKLDVIEDQNRVAELIKPMYKPRVAKVAPQLNSHIITDLEHVLSLGHANRLRSTFAVFSSFFASQRLLKLSSKLQLALLAFVIIPAVVYSGLNLSSRSNTITPRVAGASDTKANLSLQTNDITTINKAFEKVISTYHPTYNPNELLEVREHLLARYLQDWNSPLAEFADIIAQQPHWKLILAISFAESSLGKKCADNNCSGIGVFPGHPLWRTYNTKGDWAVDLNRLLEKRYKNQTLKQMCGVYVQPCNPGWLKATTQILNELAEYKID
jgi:hypothetical protein